MPTPRQCCWGVSGVDVVQLRDTDPGTASPGMQYHKLTEHFDEKPFSCEECGAKFAANSTLKNHLRLHTGDRPFMCKHCLMTFTQASALAYHTKKKHSEGRAWRKSAFLLQTLRELPEHPRGTRRGRHLKEITNKTECRTGRTEDRERRGARAGQTLVVRVSGEGLTHGVLQNYSESYSYRIYIKPGIPGASRRPSGA